MKRFNHLLLSLMALAPPVSFAAHCPDSSYVSGDR
jgi:hypothetical protein